MLWLKQKRILLAYNVHKKLFNGFVRYVICYSFFPSYIKRIDVLIMNSIYTVLLYIYC